MNEADNSNHQDERAPGAADSPIGENGVRQEMQARPHHELVNEESEAAYNANPQHMQSMPQAHNEYNMQASDGFRPSHTHNHFNPRNTFHGRSTDRGHGMSKYAKFGSNWNNRFHVSPSSGNTKSHTYYKQFFDKPTRSTQGVILKPHKRLDPYLENEDKTRIPRYSKLYKERDVGREFNWVDNFAVTHSKNNVQIHNTYKEYFDKPVSYNGAVTVATTKGVADMSPRRQISNKKRTSTIHYLVEDRSNKHAKNKEMQKSIEYNGMIPFLRDHEEKYTICRSPAKKAKMRTKSLAHKHMERENNWNRIGYPISMHNEKNHFSKKLKFEDL